MKPTSLFTLMGLSVSVIGTKAQELHMPACMSTCKVPFTANHEPDLCTPSWVSRISRCIDTACSTASAVAANSNNTTLTFVPKMQYACMQSHIPAYGDSPAAPALVVRDGQCVESPYPFLSFLPSFTDPAVLQRCRLGLYPQGGCEGVETVMTVTQDVRSGVCSFRSGKSVRLVCGETGSENAAAHNYLTSLCKPKTTAGSTTAPDSFTGIENANTTVSNMTTAANLTAAVPSVNTTTPITVAAPTASASSAVFETEFSNAENALQRGGSAKWALVVVVFARSVLL